MGLFSSPKNILAARIKKATLLLGQLPELNRKTSLEDLRIIQSARKELEDATTGLYQNLEIETCQLLFHCAIDMYSRLGDWNNAERKAKELVEYTQKVFFDNEVDIAIRVDAISNAARKRYGRDNEAAEQMIAQQEAMLRELAQYNTDLSGVTLFGPGIKGLMLRYLAIATNKYGDICRYNGKYKKSAALREKSLRFRIELGEPSLIITGLINFGHVYFENDAIDESAIIYEKALEVKEGSKSILEELVEDQLKTTEEIASILDNLSIAYAAQSKIEKAKELLLRVLKTREMYYGLNDPDVGYTLVKLSDVTRRDNSLEESKHHAQRALHILKETYGEEHPRTLGAYIALGKSYFASESFAEAEDCYLRALRSHEEQRNVSMLTLEVLAALRKLYKSQGRIDELIERYERFVSITQESTNDPFFLIILFNDIATLLNTQEGQNEAALRAIWKARLIVLRSINDLVDENLISQTYTNLIEILDTDEVSLRILFLEEAKTLLESKSAYLPKILALMDGFAIADNAELLIEQAPLVGCPHDLKTLFDGLVEQISSSRKPRIILNDVQEMLNILRRYFYHSSEANGYAWVQTCNLARLVREGCREKMSKEGMRDVVDFPDEMGSALLTTVSECLRELETIFADNSQIAEVTRLSIAATDQVQSHWLALPKKSKPTPPAEHYSYPPAESYSRPDEQIQIELDDDEKDYVLPDVKEIVAQIDENIRYERLTIPDFKAYCFFAEGEPDRVKEIFSLLDDSDIHRLESQRLALELLKIREQYLSKDSIRYATTLYFVALKCYTTEGWWEGTITLLEDSAARIIALKNQPPELAQFTLDKAAEVAIEIELYDRAISILEKMVQLYVEDKTLPISYSFDPIHKKILILTKQERYDDLLKLMPEVEAFIRKHCPLSDLNHLVRWEGLFAKQLSNSIYQRYGVSGILLHYGPFFIHNVYLRLVCASSTIKFHTKKVRKIFGDVWYFVIDILFKIVQALFFVPAMIADGIAQRRKLQN